MCDAINLDVRRAVKRSGRTHQQLADCVYCSIHTLRDYLYHGKRPGWDVAYYMAFETPGGLTLHGPRGPVRITPENHVPPPAAPVAQSPGRPQRTNAVAGGRAA